MLRRLFRLFDIDPYGNLFSENTGTRLRKLLSPRYVYGKLALAARERLRPNEPWITADAIRHLEGFLTPDRRGFEWGSGKGSLWFAQRSRSLVSVEHNAQWYERVRRAFAEAGVANIDYRLVKDQLEPYTSAIGEFPDGHFDYVLVDGLFRDHAFLKSIPKVKPGGWIVFDNVNWYLPSDSRTPHSRSRADGPDGPVFAEVADRIRAWRTIWTTNGVNDTAIFVTPEAPAARPSR
jgi:hypothetical protein